MRLLGGSTCEEGMRLALTSIYTIFMNVMCMLRNNSCAGTASLTENGVEYCVCVCVVYV
jgi:hypothetical protein